MHKLLSCRVSFLLVAFMAANSSLAQMEVEGAPPIAPMAPECAWKDCKTGTKVSLIGINHGELAGSEWAGKTLCSTHRWAAVRALRASEVCRPAAPQNTERRSPFLPDSNSSYIGLITLKISKDVTGCHGSCTQPQYGVSVFPLAAAATHRPPPTLFSLALRDWLS